MQLYAITGPSTSEALLKQVNSWAAGGVRFIQLRQKALAPAQLSLLAKEIASAIAGTHSRLLVNIPDTSFAELAFAAGADGVHLAGKPSPGVVSRLRQHHSSAIITLPCHSLEEVAIAANEQVDAMLFSPVFEKFSGQSLPTGTEELARACAAARGIPVFALGGVTPGNAFQCIAAGAVGVAGIRLFAGNDWQGLPSG